MTDKEFKWTSDWMPLNELAVNTMSMWGYLGYTPAEPCKHKPVDNGTRRSECKLCKVAMEFVNMEWVAIESAAIPEASGIALSGLAAWLPDNPIVFGTQRK